MQFQQEPSTSEWEVMKVIWTLDKATSLSISQVLKNTMNWENSTTKTLLGRLVKKGYLKTHREGNRFLYEPLISQEDGANNRITNLAESFCPKSRGQAIVHLIEHLQLSVTDKDLLLEAIKQKEFKENLSCTCLSGCLCEDGQCNCGHHQQ